MAGRKKALRSGVEAIQDELEDDRRRRDIARQYAGGRRLGRGTWHDSVDPAEVGQNV